MDVSDDELRDLVRAAIARVSAQPLSEQPRPQFALLPLPRGGDGDGACLIEPAVRCNHCGYCLSFGH
jgi:hypothetical protein